MVFWQGRRLTAPVCSQFRAGKWEEAHPSGVSAGTEKPTRKHVLGQTAQNGRPVGIQWSNSNNYMWLDLRVMTLTITTPRGRPEREIMNAVSGPSTVFFQGGTLNLERTACSLSHWAGK